MSIKLTRREQFSRYACFSFRPEGYLYDKEAIFEYIIHKKAENARKLKQYEKQKRKEREEIAKLAAADQESNAEKFINMERSVVIKRDNSDPKPGSSQSESVSNMENGRDKILPSFWVPALTPKDDKKVDLKPPDQTIYCPMSGRPLKAKDLIPVNFTPIEKGLTREKLLTRTVR